MIVDMLRGARQADRSRRVTDHYANILPFLNGSAREATRRIRPFYTSPLHQGRKHTHRFHTSRQESSGQHEIMTPLLAVERYVPKRSTVRCRTKSRRT